MSSLKKNAARASNAAESASARPGGPLKRSLKSTTMLNRLSTLGATLVVSGVILAASAGGAHAQSVGDPITNPVTGDVLTVTDVVPNGVLATGNVFILTTTMVGAVLPDPDDPDLTVTIDSVSLNPVTHLIESVTFTDARVLNVVTPITTATSAPAGGTITLPAGAGDSGQVSDVRRGDGGVEHVVRQEVIAQRETPVGGDIDRQGRRFALAAVTAGAVAGTGPCSCPPAGAATVIRGRILA